MIFIMVVATAVAWAAWTHHVSGSRDALDNRPKPRMIGSQPQPPVAAKFSAPLAKSAVGSQQTLEDRFRAATDYAAFAMFVRADAEAGRPDAQFYLAEALTYCKRNLGRFLIVPGQRTRTLNEAQVRWATRPAGYQQEIVDVYNRCHAFLESPGPGISLNEGPQWLERSVAGAYPPAEMEKAVLSSVADIVATGHQSERDRDLALKAVQSGDPQVLWQMSDFVHQRKDPQQSLLIDAWQLLACERGFDCSTQADWLRSACNYDPNCADGETGVEYLKRQLGDNAPEAEALANQIGAAIDSKDWSELPSYLWADPPAALAQYQ